MEYREAQPPETLRPLVKLGWSLSVPDDGPQWVTHVATPDGCMELIHRLSGNSRWGGEQPDRFVAGIITRPAELRLAAGSRFVALRIWPWAWRLISGRSPGELVDGWAAADAMAPRFELASTLEGCFEPMLGYSADAAMRAVAAALPNSESVDELCRRSGMSPRSLQRWFQSNVGQPPRSYLRMVRFSEALAELPSATAGLAGLAADHGFADQAHMAREFRALAGTPARDARSRARGPFIDQN